VLRFLIENSQGPDVCLYQTTTKTKYKGTSGDRKHWARPTKPNPRSQFISTIRYTDKNYAFT